MVRVTICEEGERHTLGMEGHADYSPGNDIVCAGCSAIAYALMGWLANFPDHTTAAPEMKASSGSLLISASGDECLDAAFDTTMIGLMQIASKYPDHVQIKIISES